MRRARSALLLSLLALVTTAVPAVASSGDIAAVTSATGWTAVAGDGRGGVLISTPTRILRVQHDNSFTVVAGSDAAPVHARELAADPTDGDVFFREGLTVKRVHDGAISTVFDESGDPSAIGPTIAVAPDGALHVLDDTRVWRVDDDGTVAQVATVPEFGFEGAFAISRTGEMAVAGPSGIWRRTTGAFTRTTLGDCSQAPDPCGDGGPASAARVFAHRLDYDAHGRLYEAEPYRVRVIDTDGTIRHVAGSWQRPDVLCGAPDCGANGAAAQLPMEPNDIATDGDDLLITTAGVGRLLRVLAPASVPAAPPQGYRMIASDGGVFTFGWSPFHGSTGDVDLVSPIVAARSNGAGGYWFVAGDGGVFSFGDARFFGSAAGKTDSPVVDMAVHDDGDGYAILERDGSVLAFGRTFDVDRPDFGAPSAALVRIGPGQVRVIAEHPSALPHLNAPIVAAHATASGKGTWLVASDGGVFTTGDAGFFGSTGAMRLNQPVLDLIPTPSERGYWLIAADGGVFTFGDATFFGSMGAVRLNEPVVAGVAGSQASG